MLDLVLIQKGTTAPITAVSVSQKQAKKFGAVNLLLPLKSFDIRVSKRPILGKEAVISWMDENGRQREEAVPLPYNRDIAQTNRKVNLVSVIQPSGQVDALLQPSSE